MERNAKFDRLPGMIVDINISQIEGIYRLELIFYVCGMHRRKRFIMNYKRREK